MEFVAIDLGASNTRFVTNNGSFSSLSNKSRFIDTIKDGKRVPDLTPVNMVDIGDNLEDALELIIYKESNGFVPNEQVVSMITAVREYSDILDMFPMHALVGTMAERFTNALDIPSGVIPKAGQRINYLSLLTCIVVSKIREGLGDDINVFVDLPPLQSQVGREVFKNILPGKYTVDLPKYRGGLRVTFNISTVKVSEESAMAM